MPTLKHEDLIKEYYNTVKDKYPSVSFTEFEKICKNPFKCARRWIQSELMPIIHIKYLGKFMVTERRIRAVIKDNRAWHKRGIITDEQLAETLAFLEPYLALLIASRIDRQTHYGARRRDSTDFSFELEDDNEPE